MCVCERDVIPRIWGVQYAHLTFQYYVNIIKHDISNFSIVCESKGCKGPLDTIRRIQLFSKNIDISIRRNCLP